MKWYNNNHNNNNNNNNNKEVANVEHFEDDGVVVDLYTVWNICFVPVGFEICMDPVR